MTNRPFAALFTEVAQETRHEATHVASRLRGRVDELVAQTSGLAASRVDEAGERWSATVQRSLAQVAHRAGNGIVRLAEVVSRRL